MSPETKKLLEHFAANANWGALGNPIDMERFWEFVISAYRHGEHDISLNEFIQLVGPQSKSKEDVSGKKFSNKQRDLTARVMMFNKYEDGIKLLSQFEGK